MPKTPVKLKQDTIVEAVLEIRFDHAEMAEIAVGRLASSEHWSGYTLSRMPMGNLPAEIIQADPNLRFHPTIQLERPDPGEIVRIGPRVMSLHAIAPYPGWSHFLPRLQALFSVLLESVPDPLIHKVGLRYVNAITPDHGFKSFNDLEFTFSTRTWDSDNLLIAYKRRLTENMTAQVKIASMEYVQGQQQEGAVAYVDVDVSTVFPLGKVDAEALTNWVIEAHKAEKEVFFALWPDEILEAMSE